MIKALATRKGGRLCLLIILSEENIKRLKGEYPINFYAQEMDMDKIQVDEVMIAYFETEEQATEHFIKIGLLDINKIVKGDGFKM